MPDFVKPTQVAVQIDEAFRHMLPKRLIKDLHGDEAICPMCHGLGLRVVDNIYGLSDDPDKTAGFFPYKHQALTFCLNCYSGVVHICPDCGKQLPKNSLRCNCEAEQRRQREAEHKKYLVAIEKAEKCEPNTLGKRFLWAYSEFFSYNDGYFSDWEEFFDSWHEDHDENDGKPEYVWGTEAVEMVLDAEDIISQSCEDMHEDAINDISPLAIESMQNFFESWKRQYATVSYCYTYQYAIKIPWEEDT